jgi:DNA-binding response OmpR family regulator
MLTSKELYRGRESITVALWAEELLPRLEQELAAAGCRVVWGAEAERFQIVVLCGDARLALVQATQLRNSGFRGVIVAWGRGLAPSEALALRTAGINDVVEADEESELASAVIASWARIAEGSLEAVELGFSADENSRRVRVGGVQVVLSAARFRLFECLTRRPGAWWRASELVAAVQRTHHAFDSPLVRVHMNAIRNALGMARWCVQSERTFGYQFVTNPDVLPLLGSGRAWSHGHKPPPALVEPRGSGEFPCARPLEPVDDESSEEDLSGWQRGRRRPSGRRRLA